MEIQDYSFGEMKINDKTYSNDLKIFPTKVKPDWWRKEGHLLQETDLEDVLEFEPELLVIGQGAHGRMKIDESLKEKLDEMGIKYINKNTKKAVDYFNRNSDRKTVGVFHLTC